MKIFLMADYPSGVEVIKFLQEQGEEIVGAALHPQNIQKCNAEIVELLNLDDAKTIDGTDLHDPQNIDKIKAMQPDIIMCVFWGIILKEEIINIPSKGCINFHLSYLPFNKGKNPNVWPIIEGTPAGYTIHYIDAGVDTGDIIAQEQVEVEPIDTGKTVYAKLTNGIVNLFKKTWPDLKVGNIERIKQQGEGTFHLAKDFNSLSEIDLDKQYKARDLINLIRSRSFPPFPGCYYIEEGKKVFIRTELEYEK